MAKLTKNEKVIIPAKAAVTETTYTLEMDKAEAEALRSLLGVCHSGGVTSAIFDALYRANVQSTFNVVDANGRCIDYLKVKGK